MKYIAIIPARYCSTRFPGKPLADICGHPMIYWVYQQVKKVKKFSDVIVATDDERIRKVCEQEHLKVIMTRNDHNNHISRIQEVSDKIISDYYVCINGDEPLIEEKNIEAILPEIVFDTPYFCGARRILTDPVETNDIGNIKLAMTGQDRCVYMSRLAIPFPKGTLHYHYYKYVGIEVFNKQALDFFVHTEMGILEKIEDIDHLRFLENGIPLFFKEVKSDSLSVDTPKDLEKVREIMQKRLIEKK